MQKTIRITDAPSKVIAAIELNVCAYIVAFIGKISGSQLVRRPEITYITSGIQDARLNYVCRTKASDDSVKGVVGAIVAYFKQDETPFMWLIGPTTQPKNLDKVLLKQGLVLEEDLIGMTLDLSNYDEECSDHDTMQIQRCVSSMQVNDFGYVHSSTTENMAQGELWSRMMRAEWTEQEPLELYVGISNDVPVTTGILFVYGGVAGIYCLATMPAEREKGFGSAMMRFLLKRAKSLNYDVAVVKAPTDQVNFYRDFGFNPACVFQTFTLQWDQRVL